MDNKKIKTLAHKMLAVAKDKDCKTVGDLTDFFPTAAPLDFNCAVWWAQDNELMKLKGKKGKLELLDGYSLSELDDDENVDHLRSVIVYLLEQLEKTEQDPEQNWLISWCEGYHVHDVYTALRVLEDLGAIARYEVKDSTNTEEGDDLDIYTFVTLYNNKDKEWGWKQFKDQSQLES